MKRLITLFLLLFLVLPSVFSDPIKSIEQASDSELLQLEGDGVWGAHLLAGIATTGGVAAVLYMLPSVTNPAAAILLFLQMVSSGLVVAGAWEVGMRYLPF